MKFAECKAALAAFGYGLEKNQTDAWGKKHPYCSFPAHGTSGGATNYFDSLDRVEAYIKNVTFIRNIEAELTAQGL